MTHHASHIEQTRFGFIAACGTTLTDAALSIARIPDVILCSRPPPPAVITMAWFCIETL